jgi:hypothetical protein
MLIKLEKNRRSDEMGRIGPVQETSPHLFTQPDNQVEVEKTEEKVVVPDKPDWFEEMKDETV